MNLIVSKSKNSATYYIQKSFRSDSGKTTARIVERLGSIKELIARFGEEDPIGCARKYVAELTAQEKVSKLSSIEDAKRFIEQPEADIHQVYRALSILAKESDEIQASVYKNSLKLGKRRDAVIYYCRDDYAQTS